MAPLPAHRGRVDRTFERLYRRHGADVYRYALAVLHNEADAEDVTQTTFLNAYRALQRGERPRAPHNWLIAIAHNVCRQRFRQSTRRPSEVAWDDDVADRLVDDDVPSGDDVRRALSHLAFNQRAALVMRELEGRSYAEIAEVLELSTGAVETLLFRARRALREQLDEGITCGEAERAISKQLDGRLARAERASLRAHLRECPECATFARRQRAQRSALRSLGAVPLPASLASLFGGGGGGATAVVAAKAAAAVAAAALVGGAGYESVHRVLHPPAAHPAARASASSDPSPAHAATAAALPVEHARHGRGPAHARSRERGRQVAPLGVDAALRPHRPKRAHRHAGPQGPAAHSNGRAASAPVSAAGAANPARPTPAHVRPGAGTGASKRRPKHHHPRSRGSRSPRSHAARHGRVAAQEPAPTVPADPVSGPASPHGRSGR